ncbi:MAG: ATP phosphoribosyltransferase regulatory subunit [Anaerolineales bacterium]|nr:ATP phosphoribosyltransferase regulatory subunit [Anaerolineales bacterium]
MKDLPPLSRQLPHGVKDLFLDEAANIAEIENRLRELFPRWGYSQIIPPTFEYYDSYAAGAGAELREQMYRLFDRDGRTLALRPDLTIPIARVAGTKLYDQPLPLRFFYVENVFRFEEPQAGRQREFTQAGIELIGAATPEADAEALALAIEAMRTAGVTDFQISLGQMAYFRALLADLDLSQEDTSRVRTAVDGRNVSALTNLLEELGIDPESRRAIAALPKLAGGASILTEARASAANGAAHQALDHLEDVYRLLRKRELAGHILLDLGEVRGMDYYTGITFEGFVRGLGFSVVNGGRYDDLVGHYGDPLPAVGWGLGIERVLLALKERGRATAPVAPEAVVAACDHPACRWVVEDLRKSGVRVEYDVLGRSSEELKVYAEKRHIRQVLACSGAGELHVVHESPSAEPDSQIMDKQ